MNCRELTSGVVVIYNADFSVIKNIKTYLDSLGKLYIVDNSDLPDQAVTEALRVLPHSVYISNNGNKGIAAALNKGAQCALEDGYKYILTMDQDSHAEANMVTKLVAYIENRPEVGLISPYHIYEKFNTLPPGSGCEEITAVMTSGNIVNLEVYQKAGGFIEPLFVDFVDIEFCLRLRQKGYKVLRARDIPLFHCLGDIRQRRFLFWRAYPTNHSALRLYYRTRNRFYARKLYYRCFPSYFHEDAVFFLKDLIKIVFFEENKIDKLKMIITGYLHYRKNKFGKYPDVTLYTQTGDKIA